MEKDHATFADDKIVEVYDAARAAQLGVDESFPHREGVITLRGFDPDRINVVYDDEGGFDHAVRYNANGAVVGSYSSLKAVRDAVNEAASE